MRHVDFLTRPELGGRLTGTEGERRATAYVAAYLESLGFEPAGQDGTFFHTFDFPAGSRLTGGNAMSSGGESLAIDEDWHRFPFPRTGSYPQPVSFSPATECRSREVRKAKSTTATSI